MTRGIHSRALVVAAATWFASLAPSASFAADDSPAPSSKPTVEERMKQRRAVQLSGGADASDLPSPTTDSSTSTSPRRPVPGRPVTAAEWDATTEAMRKHTPNWLARFDRLRLPEDSQRRHRMMRQFVERYRELQRVAQRDPAQYDREIEQVELEDEILGAARDLWRNAPADEAATAELKKNLRNKVGELVEMRIRNRELRIERIAKTLETERERLEAEKRNRDNAIDRQFDAVVNGQGLPGGLPAGRDGSRGEGADRPEPANTAASPVTPKSK